MVIDIPQQRKPLFQILEAKTFVKSGEYLKSSKEEREYWQSLLKVDTVIDYGGRESGKSFCGSIFEAIAVADYGHRVLSTRYIMNSTDQSITEAIENRLEMLGYSDRFQFANNTYLSGNGGKIFISGIKTSSLNQTAKLKSLEDFSIFKVEEAEELPTYAEWVKIKRSIRAKDVQCLSILSFNPPPKDHWIFIKFFLEKKVSPGFSGIVDNVLYIYSNYLHNYENMADHNRAEYDKLREDYELYENSTQSERDQLPKIIENHWREYKYDILGGFKNRAEGTIFNSWKKGKFDDSLPVIWGLDWGSVDPFTLTKFAFDNGSKTLYIKNYVYKTDLSTKQIHELCHKYLPLDDLVICDCANKTGIRDLRDEGFNAMPCFKNQGSVSEGIRGLLDWTFIVDDSPEVENELNNYIWLDKRGDVPIDKFNHTIDPMRYAYQFAKRDDFS